MGEEGAFSDSDLSSKSKCLLGTLRSLKGLFAGEATTTIARVRREQKGHTQTMRLGRRGGERRDGEWGPFAARTSRLLSSLSIIPAGRGRASLSPSQKYITYVLPTVRESKCMHALVH